MVRWLVDENDQLEIVEEIKLLGIIITSDMKWEANTKHLTSKGYARLWMLRNLKQYGASEVDLLTVYKTQVRSVLELACTVWSSALTHVDKREFERVKKNCSRHH